jgi:hypothetical protein
MNAQDFLLALNLTGAAVFTGYVIFLQALEMIIFIQ